MYQTSFVYEQMFFNLVNNLVESAYEGTCFTTIDGGQKSIWTSKAIQNDLPQEFMRYDIVFQSPAGYSSLDTELLGCYQRYALKANSRTMRAN